MVDAILQNYYKKKNYNKNILADENPPQISKYKAEKG